MTSSQHGPYAQGDTRVTMANTKGGDVVRRSKSQKVSLSSDRGLQPDLVKLKSLVIAHQIGAVNTFSDLVHTARHTMKAVCTRNCLS